MTTRYNDADKAMWVSSELAVLIAGIGVSEGSWWLVAFTLALAFALWALLYWWSEPVNVVGWVVSDAQGERFRCWGDWGPAWTREPGAALHFARRKDAEKFCEEDEDAWRVFRRRMEP